MNTFETYKALLTEFVALKSISTDVAYLDEMTRTVAFLRAQFKEHGFQVTEITDPGCNPVLVATYDAKRPTTCLIYGHYDVQPAEQDGWTSAPFALAERDGRLFGRGVVDNKGQILAHMIGVFENIEHQTLRTNVTFMIEGNEETANPVLGKLVKERQELLACDEIIISDGEIVQEIPTIEASLRGGFNMKVSIRTATTDLHSGLAGGAVPSAATVLTTALSKLIREDGYIMAPGFYDGVSEISAATLQTNQQLETSTKPAETLQVDRLLSANKTDFYTQTGLYPTAQITGIKTGYTGAGFANIVPAAAEARINVRTVAPQDSMAIATAIESFLRTSTPDYAQIKIETVDPHPPILLNTDTPAAKRAHRLLADIYPNPPIYKSVGGAIPVVSDLKESLGVDPLLVSMGNDDCNMHGANENFRIDLIEYALAFSSRFFQVEST